MIITAAKIATVEAITAAFSALGPTSSNTTKDLVPRSVTIEYPVEEIAWPAVYVQFRPTLTQYTGLNPDSFVAIKNEQGQTTSWEQVRQGYFEGAFDLQILHLHFYKTRLDTILFLFSYPLLLHPTIDHMEKTMF